MTVQPSSRDGSSSAAPSDAASTLDLSGRCVGNSYLLVRPIGHGATGTVWCGIDRSSGEQVAVKLLHESLLRQPKLVTRFVQERTILLMLRHRNVVRVRDLFSVGESLGLVMDLVPGGSLREHLREHRTVPAGEAARLAAQVAAALCEAHELGVIHRDLKPDNILLQYENGRLDTRLTDFGIARVLNTPSLTTPHAVVGTPHYMAPEAFHGAPTSPAADVYALGILLYELVVGCPPFVSDSVADLMRRHVEEPPTRPPGIPDELWEVVAACLEKKPRLRPTAAELVIDLNAVARSAADVPALPHPEPPPPVIPQPRSAGAVPAVLRSAVEHPSRAGSPHPPPQPRNQVPAWRWARPWVVVALVGGAMVASVLATSAWHLNHPGEPKSRVLAAGDPADESVRQSAWPMLPPSVVRSPASTPATPKADAAKPSTRTKIVVVRATPVSARPDSSPGGTRIRTEAQSYGSWQCREDFRFSFTDPVLAKPCHALGDDIRVLGRMVAPAGTRATITLRLRDVTTGRTVAGPSRCPQLTFTGRDLTDECGPVRLKAPRGHRYQVMLDWRYSRQGASARGSAPGREFSW